jgi:hypothetical protein
MNSFFMQFKLSWQKITRRVGLPSADQQQGYVWYDIENNEEDFVEPDERVQGHIECLTRNGKPFAV